MALAHTTSALEAAYTCQTLCGLLQYRDYPELYVIRQPVKQSRVNMLVRSVNKIGKKTWGVPENVPPSSNIRLPPYASVVGGYNRQGQTFHFPGRHADRLSEGSRTLSPLSGARQGESQAQNYKELPHHWYFQ